MLNVDCDRINWYIITCLDQHVTTLSTDTDINLQAEHLLLLALLTLATLCNRLAANVRSRMFSRQHCDPFRYEKLKYLVRCCHVL